MTIFEMLDAWVAWTHKDDTKLGFNEKSAGFRPGGNSWGNAFEDWELELNGRIGEAMDVLINGEGGDKGILTIGEQVAIQNNHVAAVWQSNRSNINDDYASALTKLTKAMQNRGFLVD